MTSERSRRAFLPVAAGPALSFRTLGKTGLKVTSIGFGCMVTSDASVISKGLDMGITYFDTARGYGGGNNERMVGACLKGSRQKVVLSSKSRGKTAAEATEHLETSLRELGTDYLDIWYMHYRDEPAAITDELIATWEKAKQQGKIRHIGVSTHNPNAIVDRVLSAGKFEVLLSTYNFMVGGNNDAAFERLHSAGIGLVAMKVMAPAAREYGFKADRSGRMQKQGTPLAALKWVHRNPLFTTAIPSMVDMDQLEENVRAMAEPFTPEDAKLLAAAHDRIGPYSCRMCFACSGQCPKGVPVPEQLRFLSYADFYGQFALGREHFLGLPEQVREMRCKDCSACEVRCPNGVRVRERLTRAQEVFA